MSLFGFEFNNYNNTLTLSVQKGKSEKIKSIEAEKERLINDYSTKIERHEKQRNERRAKRK